MDRVTRNPGRRFASPRLTGAGIIAARTAAVLGCRVDTG